MNKVYKVVWNASLGVWVAVSEIAKGKTKSSCLNEEQHNNDNSITKPKQDKLFLLKPLAYSIIIAFFPLAVNAATGDGGGTRTGGAGTSNTAISPTSAQCNVLGFSQSQATVDGADTIQSVAIGCGSLVGATNTTSQQIGDRRGGTDPVAYPSGETGYRSAGTAIGNRNSTAGGGGLAIGTGNASTGNFYGVAVGQGNNADAYGVAVGIGNLSNSTSAVAIGTANQATGNTAVAVGRQSYAKADYGIAVGNVATVEVGATNGIAIGNTASVLGTATNSVAIGKDATSNVSNSVALGAGSTTTAQSGNSFLTNVAPSATNGVVSVGTTGTTRRIQNVADGAALTDAVNVAQLDKAYDDAHSRLATALGGGAAYDTNTNLYTPPSYTINKADIGSYAAVTNVGAALSNLNTEIQREITFVGNTGSVGRNLGENLNITGGLAGAGSNSNVKTVISGNTVDIQIADAPNFAGTVTSTGQQVNGNSVVTGTSTIGSGVNAVTLSGTANGLDVGNKKITNVAAPTVGSDATNKTYVDGKVQTLADTPLGFVGDSGTKATRKLGEDLNVKGGATGTLTNGNIGVVSNGSNQLDIKLAETVNLGTNGSVTTGNTKIDNSGLTITGGPSVTNTGINAANKNISNVADATTADQAVNKGQLDAATTAADNKTDALGNSTASNLGGGSSYDNKTGTVSAP
ncbi:hypothetical protein MJ004_02410, partial [Acinetobacter junii]